MTGCMLYKKFQWCHMTCAVLAVMEDFSLLIMWITLTTPFNLIHPFCSQQNHYMLIPASFIEIDYVNVVDNGCNNENDPVANSIVAC